MLELFICFCVLVLGFFLGYVKGSMDEEERQRKLRKKIYSMRKEANDD